MSEKQMVLRLVKDKVTKNDVIRYADSDGHNIYLKPEDVKRLGGDTGTIRITMEAV